MPQARTATLVQGGFSELEGPVWVEAQKALYFCEGGGAPNNGRIHKYTPADDQFVVFLDNVGVGGLAVDSQGMLIAASYDTRTISRIDPATGMRTDLPAASIYMGKPFNSLNDVVVRSDGNIYFSDPAYEQYDRPGQDMMAFYRWAPPSGPVTRIVVGSNANGVALSPDGAWLYLGTTGNGGPPIQRFAVATDGAVALAGSTWNEPTSDGMAVDCAGNLYLSESSQIRVVSSTDQPLGTITGLGSSYVTNSAFGSENHQTLYITTGAALYQIQLNVPGFPN